MNLSPRFLSKGKAALIFQKRWRDRQRRLHGRRFARTVRLYSRIVERLVITIRGRKVSNIEHFSQRTESLNKGGTSRVAFAELNQNVLENFMNKLVLGLVASVTLFAAAPAGAQVFIGADSGGAGVQLGPVGVGVGPRFSDDRYYRRGYDANAYYGSDCRLIRSRVVTPGGRVVFRTRQVCG